MSIQKTLIETRVYIESRVYMDTIRADTGGDLPEACGAALLELRGELGTRILRAWFLQHHLGLRTLEAEGAAIAAFAGGD